MTAAAWLLDLVPEYRQYPAVRQHPVVLAFIARHVPNGAVEGARQGYRTTRSELGEVISPDVVAAALAEFRTEGSACLPCCEPWSWRSAHCAQISELLDANEGQEGQ